MNATCKIKSTAITRARKPWARLAERNATAAVHPANINTHNNKEPSCEPHEAAKRYAVGNKLFEFSATLRTEKSFAIKLHIKAPNDKAMRKKFNKAVPVKARDK